MKIFIVMLRLKVWRLKFESLLFEHLLLLLLLRVVLPLDGLLVNGWVGVVDWGVPGGHGLSVDSELSLRGVGGVLLLDDAGVGGVLHGVHLLTHHACAHH